MGEAERARRTAMMRGTFDLVREHTLSIRHEADMLRDGDRRRMNLQHKDGLPKAKMITRRKTARA